MSIVYSVHPVTYKKSTQHSKPQATVKAAQIACAGQAFPGAPSVNRVLKRRCCGLASVHIDRTRRSWPQLTRAALSSVPFNPKKLTVQYQSGTLPSGTSSLLPRRYTLTHNDLTGQLLLSIGSQYNRKQLSGWYNRLLRDEILAHWQWTGPSPVLHIECHVSGRETWLAPPVLRDYIFRREMPLVLNIVNFAEAKFLGDNPRLANAQVMVHLSSHVPAYHASVPWGSLADSNSWHPPPRWVWKALQRRADSQKAVTQAGGASSRLAPISTSIQAAPQDQPCVIASFGLDSECEPCSVSDSAELCQQPLEPDTALDRPISSQTAPSQGPEDAEDRQPASRHKVMAQRPQSGGALAIFLPQNLTASRRFAYADSLLGLVAAASTLAQL